MYGPRVLSATDHAWNTRVEQALARKAKRYLGVVFLDCSKCYERVPHHMAITAAYSLDAPQRSPTLFLRYTQGLVTSVCILISPRSAAETQGSLQGAVLLFTYLLRSRAWTPQSGKQQFGPTLMTLLCLALAHLLTQPFEYLG